jgi:hypothetical protein
MSVRDDNQAHIDALAEQLHKVKIEFVAAIQDLKDQFEIGDGLDFSRVDALAQDLDNMQLPRVAKAPPSTVEPVVEP